MILGDKNNEKPFGRDMVRLHARRRWIFVDSYTGTEISVSNSTFLLLNNNLVGAIPLCFAIT